jgi:hypothetical protein
MTSNKLSALPSDFQSTPVGRSATSLRMKSSVWGALGSLPRRKRVCRHWSRVVPNQSFTACRTVQWRGRHHHDNVFRLKVIGDRQPALAQVSILFCGL